MRLILKLSQAALVGALAVAAPMSGASALGIAGKPEAARMEPIQVQAPRCPPGQAAFRKFVYAATQCRIIRVGEGICFCPTGYKKLRGIGGGQCAASRWACAARPSCGSGVC